MAPRLSRVVFLLRNVQNGIRFYRDGLGLQLEAETPSHARLTSAEGLAIELNAAESYVQSNFAILPYRFHSSSQNLLISHPNVIVLRP